MSGMAQRSGKRRVFDLLRTEGGDLPGGPVAAVRTDPSRGTDAFPCPDSRKLQVNPPSPRLRRTSQSINQSFISIKDCLLLTANFPVRENLHRRTGLISPCGGFFWRFRLSDLSDPSDRSDLSDKDAGD